MAYGKSAGDYQSHKQIQTSIGYLLLKVGLTECMPHMTVTDKRRTVEGDKFSNPDKWVATKSHKSHTPYT